MSYTPTTEEVREVYRGCLVQTDTNIYSFVDEAQADGEFDRWLAEVKAQERKHVINLLNQHRLPNCNGDTDESGYCLTCTINLHDAIDIINGGDDAADSD